ncbi:MAG: DUF4229 domain-containing protein [Candidatus Nanopelagicales bacterium]
MDDAKAQAPRPPEHPHETTNEVVESVDLTDGGASATTEAGPAIETGPAIGSEAPAGPVAGRGRSGHPILVYTLARFGLLIVAGLVCYLAGARGILLIVLAFLISGLLSYVVLYRQRDNAGVRMGGYFSRMNQKIEDSKSAEDDLYEDAAPVSTTRDDPDGQK